MMYRKLLSIVLVTVVLLVIGFFVGMRFSRKIDQLIFPRESSFFETGGPTYETTVFDNTYVLQNTSVSVGYPEKGFYGWGMMRSDEMRAYDAPDPSTHSISFHSRSQEPGAEPLISLGVIVESLESIKSVRQLAKEGLGYGYTSEHVARGSFVTLNGHEYLVFKESADSSHASWHAFAVGRKEKIAIYMNYGIGISMVAHKAYRNNDQLFFQILSHVNFD